MSTLSTVSFHSLRSWIQAFLTVPWTDDYCYVNIWGSRGCAWCQNLCHWSSRTTRLEQKLGVPTRRQSPTADWLTTGLAVRQGDGVYPTDLDYLLVGI
jgi:hypothetical protein